MPVSTSVHISYCLALITGLQPRSVLDIGCGFGMWGFLCRKYLDVFQGRVQPHEWATRIDGVELFEPYIMGHQRSLYDSVRIADVRKAVEDIDHYDLVIAGDIIEHLNKDEAEDLLEQLYAKADRAMLVNIPIGPGWIYPEAYGNPGELHRSEWYPADFEPFGALHQSFGDGRLSYGVFLCRKPIHEAVRLLGWLKAAQFYDDREEPKTGDRYRARAHAANPSVAEALCNLVAGGETVQPGDIETAVAYLRGAHESQPEIAEFAELLADLLVPTGQFSDAIGVLERSLQANPRFHSGYLRAAELYRENGNAWDAANILSILLKLDGVPVDCRVRAEKMLDQFSG